MKSTLISSDSETFLCDRYLISDFTTVELLKAYETLSEEFPRFSFLCTLDDLNQATYTSMHTSNNLGFNNTKGYDLSDLPDRCFEEGEHLGYLTTKNEFFIRKTNYLIQVKENRNANFRAKDLTLDEESLDIFIEANLDPSQQFDKDVYLLKVPTKEPLHTLATLPNGYFTGDLNPFETFALAKYLDDEYGYRVFGIGASLIAFKKTAPLEKGKATSLRDLLIKMYWNENAEYLDDDDAIYDLATFKTFVEACISDRTLLVLRYTE